MATFHLSYYSKEEYTYVVDDVLLLLFVAVLFAGRRRPLVGVRVDGADDVHLVVLERQVVLVHVDDVVRVVDAEAEKEQTRLRERKGDSILLMKTIKLTKISKTLGSFIL